MLWDLNPVYLQRVWTDTHEQSYSGLIKWTMNCSQRDIRHTRIALRLRDAYMNWTSTSNLITKVTFFLNYFLNFPFFWLLILQSNVKEMADCGSSFMQASCRVHGRSSCSYSLMLTLRYVTKCYFESMTDEAFPLFGGCIVFINKLKVASQQTVSSACIWLITRNTAEYLCVLHSRAD